MSSLPPVARRLPGADPHAWLEQRDEPEVLAHLQAENAWLEQQLAPQQALRQQLFDEIRQRIRETDLSLPAPDGPWLYYQRTTAGDEYPRYYRCARPADGSLPHDSLATDAASEQLLLDPNELAGDGFLDLATLAISPDHRLLAWSLDDCGDEVYRLFVRDLESGEEEELPFDDCSGNLCWANDNRTLLFTSLDDTQRPHQLHRWQLGDEDAELLLEEEDGRFFLHCERSSDEQWLIAVLSSKTSSEAWVLDANQPQGELRCLTPRREDHEYYPDHGLYQGQSCWLIRSNRDGINFSLWQAGDDSASEAAWQPLTAHDPQRMLEEIHLNAAGLSLGWREQGQQLIEIWPAAGKRYRVAVPDAVYSLHVSDTLEFSSPVIRLRYESLNQPAQILALELATGAQQVLRQTPVEGDFDATAYESRRLWVTARDGVQVPVSLVGRTESFAAPAPLYLYGYGAYGDCLDPWFSHARLSLLERGFIFAIAHVRGGGELGEAWYRAGKLEHKVNSFNDFVDCADALVTQGFTRREQLVISGGSAGGLLIGATLNQRPDLCAAAIAEVPFVDVLKTMQDPDLPLTVTEYEEWGNPNLAEDFARIASWSPLDNLKPASYPHLLVVAGYHDTRVQYWEAAKWVAALRELKQDEHQLLLKTEFNAGHGGMSGRYQALHDVALEYAFILKVLGMA